MREDGDVIKTRDEELDDFIASNVSRLSGTEHAAVAAGLATELAGQRELLAAYWPTVCQLKANISTLSNQLGTLGVEL